MPLSPTDGIQLKYNSATPTLADGQTVQARCDANGQMLTSVASLPLPSGAATSANQTTEITALTAIQTSVEIMDDWDETDRAKVNPIVGQAGVQGGSGAVSANTQRVVLATDVALPAGTNAIGKLAANSGVDIGDTDVTSIIPGTGATNLGKAVDSAAGATDTVVAVGLIRDDALTTLTPADGDYTNGRTDSTGSQWVTLSTKIAGEDQTADVMKTEQQYSSTLITTATTTTSKSGAGRLHSINILKTLAGAVDVYDNTAGSGTKVASFAAGTTPASFMFNCTMSVGITTVTASADTVQLNWR